MELKDGELEAHSVLESNLPEIESLKDI